MKGLTKGNGAWKRTLTVCSLTAMHCEWRRRAAIPPLNVFLMVPFRCRERWLLPSRPPRPRHREGSEILGVNMAFTTPLEERSRVNNWPHKCLNSTNSIRSANTGRIFILPFHRRSTAFVLTCWSSGADRWRSAMTGCSESDQTIRSGRNGPGRSPAGASPRTAAAAHTDALWRRTPHSEHATLAF